MDTNDTPPSEVLLSSVFGDHIIELHKQKIVMKDKKSEEVLHTIHRSDEHQLYTTYKKLIS